MKKIGFYQISSGLFSIITGLMLAFLRGNILNMVITVIGIGFIVSGLAFGIKHITKFSLLKIIMGICTVVFGNTFINLSMYIMGIALIVLGITQFVSANSYSKGRMGFRYMTLVFIRPVLTLVAGVFIFFNPLGSIEALFLVCGILMTAGGAWDLYRGIKFSF